MIWLPEELILEHQHRTILIFFLPQAHIFTKNKATWLNLDDKIPFFERMYDRNKIWPKTSLDKLDTVLSNLK